MRLLFRNRAIAINRHFSGRFLLIMITFSANVPSTVNKAYTQLLTLPLIVLMFASTSSVAVDALPWQTAATGLQLLECSSDVRPSHALRPDTMQPVPPRWQWYRRPLALLPARYTAYSGPSIARRLRRCNQIAHCDMDR